LNLTKTPHNDFLITSYKRNESESAENYDGQSAEFVSSSLKDEAHSALKPTTLLRTDRSEIVAYPCSPMTDTKGIVELQETQRRQAELEERFLQKIPVFKPIEDSNS
jgi:hypothetical protein